MTRIKYEEKNLRAATLEVVAQANVIIADYQAQGFVLTLRQLYYQFVSGDFIENTERSYKRLGSIINDGRMAGLIDWDAIEDRTRTLRKRNSWDEPADIMDAVVSQYHVDYWAGQEYRVEVWIEKEALVGVFEGVCNRLDVPFFACKGYTSQSEMWRAGRRLSAIWKDDKVPVILHFGDHDPSGMDMTRDIVDRLETFSGPGLQLKRLALNMDQIDEYGPPPNPAKMTDSRFAQYVDVYGAESWELDALEPQVLADLVENAVNEYIDEDALEKAKATEEAHRGLLRTAQAALRRELDKGT